MKDHKNKSAFAIEIRIQTVEDDRNMVRSHPMLKNRMYSFWVMCMDGPINKQIRITFGGVSNKQHFPLDKYFAAMIISLLLSHCKLFYNS